MRSESKLTKRARALVDETVAFYDADAIGRLSSDENGDPAYYGEGGRRCAIGRLMQNAAAVQRRYPGYYVFQLQKEMGGTIDPILKKKYQGLPWQLHSRLQTLHDTFLHFWDISDQNLGLTDEGRRYVKSIHRWINRTPLLSP
jgi:hypothetical protein